MYAKGSGKHRYGDDLLAPPGRGRTVLAGLALSLVASSTNIEAGAHAVPRRIVWLNLCTDQLGLFCDRLVLLDAGRVGENGAPDTVLSAANLTRVYRISVLRDTHEQALYVLPWARQPES